MFFVYSFNLMLNIKHIDFILQICANKYKSH